MFSQILERYYTKKADGNEVDKDRGTKLRVAAVIPHPASECTDHYPRIYINAGVVTTSHSLRFSPAISPASIFVKPKHFLPRSLSDAPIKYSSLSSMMRKRSWKASLVLTVKPPY